ncbi:MAG: acetate--CoA ligase [Oligoflexales bacterium]|nr:acetate--CoA ligase [Oligoflexales bacterium]
MSAPEVIRIKNEILKSTYCNTSQYKKMYEQSIADPEAFWAEQASRLHWYKKWDRVKNTNFSDDIFIEWFAGAKLNISYNCIDRHLNGNAEKIAVLWEPDSPTSKARSFTYKQLHFEVCRFANLLKAQGVGKGDRVTIYMPMLPEAAFAMLACMRIGAIHSVVFGGFSAEALAGRIIDCQSTCIITADEVVRGGKTICLKERVDEALLKAPSVKSVIVVKHTGSHIAWNSARDISYSEKIDSMSDVCPPEELEAEHPSFILYTSGSTGKPKGVMHTTGGYLLWTALTHQYVFDCQSDDIFWCTADIGWITGHSYVVYGPLCNGATTLMFEGIPHYPSHSRHWEIIDKYKVSIYYTAPTAIRSLMRESLEQFSNNHRDSLRILGSVGEPINPEAWLWYYNNVGNKRCPVVDTWWQTETGGIMIAPLPGATELKPGSATLPLFGIKPVIVDKVGEVLEGEARGNLCIADSWPGQMRTIYGDHQRFKETYFSHYPGKYFTGDGCWRDSDGYYWITGRVDDVLNVSGHRLGTAEIESALVAHRDVAEAAVVGFPHDIKGQGIYCYVTLKSGVSAHDDLCAELVKWVRHEIGPICTPDIIQWAPALPKTRSGKIMRRILRKIAENDFQNLGDISTLADPSIVEELIKNRKN